MQVAGAATWPEVNLRSAEFGFVRRGADMRQGDDGVMNKDPARPADWIAAIAARQDRTAFAALFAFYAPRIKTLLMRMGASADVGEDIAQETLLSVWRKAASFDPARASASTWIYTIARNLRIDRLRHDNMARLYEQSETVEREGPERPDATLSAEERAQRVRAALDKIPEEQVCVLKLSFFEGHAHGDIAEELKLPLGTVKSRLRLAMSRLRLLLGDLS